MNIINLKNVLAGAFVLALFGFSQSAMANSWEEGRCPQPPTGPAPCIEHQDANGDWWHFNGNGGHANEWHPDIDGDDFTFCGQSSLSCDTFVGTVELDCTLCLDGQVKKFQDDNGDWLVGVKVTDGTVTPGESGCSDISLGGFPWYAGDDQPAPGNEHDNFGEHSGVPYLGALTGNFGSIDIDYTFLGIPISLVSDGHVHGVDFNNNGTGDTPSDFQFGLASTTGDDVIYEGGNADVNSGCTVSGTLAVQPPVGDINIW